MPMLRYRSRGVTRCHNSIYPELNLPAVMREGFVSLCHPVCVFTFLNSSATVIGSIKQVRRQALLMVFSERLRDVSTTSEWPELDDAQSELRTAPGRWHHQHGGSAPQPSASRFEGPHGKSVQGPDRPFDRLVEGTVNDTFGGRFLAILHQRIHELVTTKSLNLASGRTWRFSAAWRRDIYVSLISDA